jgi:polyphosphate kinase
MIVPQVTRIDRAMAEVERYLNRELSLLDFQARVLALAENPALPLLERVKFAAIVSQNLDEFFQVRVAGLRNQVETGAAMPGDGIGPRGQLVAIRDKVQSLNERIDQVYVKDLAPALAAADIRIADWDDLGPDERAHLCRVFDEQIFPVLTPLAVDPSHPFPYISNLSLNLAVVMRNPAHHGLQFARVKVPPILPRFVELPRPASFVSLEQVIAAHLGRLFGGQEIIERFVFRVTRSADFAVEEEEANDLLEAMESVLRFRQRGAEAVRLEVGTAMSPGTLDLLTRELNLPEDAVYRREALLDLNGLWEIYALDRRDLKEEPWVPTTQPALQSPGEVNFFEVISRGDVLVHHPYDSFATSTGAFLAQAARDPEVLAIKQTLYRTSVPEDPAIGGEAAVVESLISAAEAGKQVVVLVELKARFDEAANIAWAKMLENAGAHVVYGVSGLKTHSKILLVVRREQDGLRRYAHIGTGNYNPITARLYEDLGLFTADPEIGADVAELFNALTGYNRAESYKKLLVAPATLRTRIVERIREEAANGVDGRILFKLNHLIDPDIIDELYAASEQGCRIDLIVRGICGLRAGVPGMSDNIRVRSLVGRYLEHSRIYRFGNPDTGAVYYVGSADMMPRNLNGRVEALTPVSDPALKARLQEILEVLSRDDVLAWEMDPGGDSWSKMPARLSLDAHRRLQELAIDRSAPVPPLGAG